MTLEKLVQTLGSQESPILGAQLPKKKKKYLGFSKGSVYSGVWIWTLQTLVFVWTMKPQKDN